MDQNGKKHDIFISYRRNGGYELARFLYDCLTSDGYSVTFDFDSSRSGRFDEALLRRIDECTDFIVVLNKGCFDRILDPKYPRENDWLRRELGYAIEKKKNVIPILLEGYEFPGRLPPDIDAVRLMNGPSYSGEYIDSFYGKLKDRYLKTLPPTGGGMEANDPSVSKELSGKSDVVPDRVQGDHPPRTISLEGNTSRVPIRGSDMASSLYLLCNRFRGGMDLSQYKDYVLTLFFIKFITNKFKNIQNSPITVPDGCGFEDFKGLCNKPEIGEEIDNALARLSDANPMLAGMFREIHFNDETKFKIGRGQEVVHRLTGLINIFARPEFDFNRNKAYGDIYEKLIKHFAADSGMDGGEFYTPSEVSRVLAGILGIADIRPKADEADGWTICDPACGSGSLLIRTAEEAGCDVAIHGQETNGTTAAICRMNMIIHGHETAEIMVGNTFSEPRFKHFEDGAEVLDKFDFIIMHPPWHVANWSDGYEDFGRSEGFFGMPPKKNGDYAWIMHVLKSLKTTGRAAVILPLGVLSRGNAEGTIRKAIVDRGWLEGIIAFPTNIFWGTSIPACAFVFDKARASARHGIFMIDASHGFEKAGPKNYLRGCDIEKIVSTYRTRREELHYSRFVPWREIKETNAYDLDISRYIDSGETTKDSTRRARTAPRPAPSSPASQTRRTHAVFISYSRQDLAAVKPIKEELERLGFSCWMDIEGIESGSRKFSRHLIDAIDKAHAMLFFLSVDSQASEWALKEIDYATSEHKHVVLVRFNDDQMTKEFRFDFGRADIIDWRKPEQKAKLLRDLGRWTNMAGT